MSIWRKSQKPVPKLLQIWPYGDPPSVLVSQKTILQREIDQEIENNDKKSLAIKEFFRKLMPTLSVIFVLVVFVFWMTMIYLNTETQKDNCRNSGGIVLETHTNGGWVCMPRR